MKLSEIIGKKIFGKTGKEGYVLSVCACGEKLFLLCSDENEREFCVKWDELFNSADNLFYDGSENTAENMYSLRLGRFCYDLRGNFLGRLTDCTILKGKLKTAKIGKKNYPAEALIWGDIILARELRTLSCDVTKNGKTVFKKGAIVTDELLTEAAAAGEYVQTTLKSL